jgi:DNA-binding PadR family transcriptional regulator
MRPSERLTEKIGVENLWLYVLAFLKRRDRYAYELREQVQKEFGFLPGEVTAYRVLYSLELAGFVESREDGARRYYAITEEGKRELAKGLGVLRSTIKKLSH